MRKLCAAVPVPSLCAFLHAISGAFVPAYQCALLLPALDTFTDRRAQLRSLLQALHPPGTRCDAPCLCALPAGFWVRALLSGSLCSSLMCLGRILIQFLATSRSSFASWKAHQPFGQSALVLTVSMRRWSDKPLIEYSGYNVWPRQLAAFIEEVVGEPAVLVGNSLGGYAAMATAAQHPDLVCPPCNMWHTCWSLWWYVVSLKCVQVIRQRPLHELGLGAASHVVHKSSDLGLTHLHASLRLFWWGLP